MQRPTERSCSNCDGALVDRDSQGGRALFCPACRAWWSDTTLERTREHRRVPPPRTRLSVVFEPNGTDHTDLVTRVGTWAHRSDSYYHRLDHAADEPESAVESIRAMLAQWRAAIEGAPDGAVVFLPHAFADQRTGWLRGTVRGDSVVVVPGTSRIEGWSFYPSDVGAVAAGLSDFEPRDDVAPLALSRAELLADIDASLRAL